MNEQDIYVIFMPHWLELFLRIFSIVTPLHKFKLKKELTDKVTESLYIMSVWWVVSYICRVLGLVHATDFKLVKGNRCYSIVKVKKSEVVLTSGPVNNEEKVKQDPVAETVTMSDEALIDSSGLSLLKDKQRFQARLETKVRAEAEAEYAELGEGVREWIEAGRADEERIYEGPFIEEIFGGDEVIEETVIESDEIRKIMAGIQGTSVEIEGIIEGVVVKEILADEKIVQLQDGDATSMFEESVREDPPASKVEIDITVDIELKAMKEAERLFEELLREEEERVRKEEEKLDLEIVHVEEVRVTEVEVKKQKVEPEVHLVHLDEEITTPTQEVKQFHRQDALHDLGDSEDTESPLRGEEVSQAVQILQDQEEVQDTVEEEDVFDKTLVYNQLMDNGIEDSPAMEKELDVGPVPCETNMVEEEAIEMTEDESESIGYDPDYSSEGEEEDPIHFTCGIILHTNQHPQIMSVAEELALAEKEAALREDCKEMKFLLENTNNNTAHVSLDNVSLDPAQDPTTPTSDESSESVSGSLISFENTDSTSGSYVLVDPVIRKGDDTDNEGDDMCSEVVESCSTLVGSVSTELSEAMSYEDELETLTMLQIYQDKHVQTDRRKLPVIPRGEDNPVMNVGPLVEMMLSRTGGMKPQKPVRNLPSPSKLYRDEAMMHSALRQTEDTESFVMHSMLRQSTDTELPLHFPPLIFSPEESHWLKHPNSKESGSGGMVPDFDHLHRTYEGHTSPLLQRLKKCSKDPETDEDLPAPPLDLLTPPPDFLNSDFFTPQTPRRRLGTPSSSTSSVPNTDDIEESLYACSTASSETSQLLHALEIDQGLDNFLLSPAPDMWEEGPGVMVMREELADLLEEEFVR